MGMANTYSGGPCTFFGAQRPGFRIRLFGRDPVMLAHLLPEGYVTTNKCLSVLVDDGPGGHGQSCFIA